MYRKAVPKGETPFIFQKKQFPQCGKCYVFIMMRSDYVFVETESGGQFIHGTICKKNQKKV